MRVFNAYDVLQFAVRIEENGEAFYRAAARNTHDQKVAELFDRLAAEEVGHRRTFEGMREDVGDLKPTESYEGEYVAYLQDYIDGKAVFEAHQDASSSPSGVTDRLSAFDFAIQREVDSIVYYQELRPFVPEKYHKTLDGIIAEERTHFSLLSERRKGYM